MVYTTSMHTSVAKKLREITFSQAINPHSNTFTGNSGPVSEYFISGKLTGKERDPETGLYYYGARYLDPRTSRWISADPAMWEGDYIPSAPINDQARERNQNLSGLGGIFNYVNFHVYHYGGNNPVKLVDPDGRNSVWDIDREAKTIEITIPVKFSTGTTAEQRRAFFEAAYEWEGNYNIVGLDGNYDVKVNVRLVTGNNYRGIRVNTVTFSSEPVSDTRKDKRFHNVAWNDRDMTIYQDDRSEYYLVGLFKHEIAHLLGIRDKYDTTYTESGNRRTTPISGWENNIAADHGTRMVDSRNITEAFWNFRTNKRFFI